MASILEIYAPFLASHGPVLFSSVVVCVTFMFMYHRWQSRERVVPPRGKPTDRDDFVFMDSGKGTAYDAYEHPIDHVGDDEDAPQVPYTMVTYPREEMVKRSLEFYKEMNQRRTVRFYCDKPVPLEVIENCIRVAGRVQCTIL